MKQTTTILAICILHSSFCLAQGTETGGASGFAAGASWTLGAAWASANNVRQSSACEDYDGDLIENWAEEILGTSPWTNDAWQVQNVAPAIGAFDLVPAKWKLANGFGLRTPVCDDDTDNDGWDNWSEWMSGSDPRSATSRPNPTLRCKVDAPHPCAGPLVVWVCSRFDMIGWPDAVYVRQGHIPAGESVVTLTDADLVHGHVRQGRIWAYAWSNDDGSSVAGLPSWTLNEPASVAAGQFDGIDIGFAVNEIMFGLSDKAESYARFAWRIGEGANLPADLEGYQVMITGHENLLYRVKWPRTWVHEWDVVNYNMYGKNASGFYPGAFGAVTVTPTERNSAVSHTFALQGDFGFAARNWTASSPTLHPDNNAPKPFTVKVMPGSTNDITSSASHFVTVGTFYNWMHTAAALDVPVQYEPRQDEEVYSAAIEFRFSLDPEYSEFEFFLNAGEEPLIQKRFPAPDRIWNDRTRRRDLVVWRCPYNLRSLAPGGFLTQSYYWWKVTGYSPAVYGGVSSSGLNFRAPFVDDASAAGAIVVYVDVLLGGGTNNLRLGAWRNPALSGQPDADIYIGDSSSIYALSGLDVSVPYFVGAYSTSNSRARGYVGGRRPVPVYAERANHKQNSLAITWH